MLNYINKDITTIEVGVLAHGVNCQGAMNSGVAKSIRRKWPQVYDTYRKIGSNHKLLGMCSLITIDVDKLYVANCYTQVFYGYGGRFASLKAIEDSVWKAYEYADLFHIPLYMPKIGTGRGGLSWTDEVEPIIAKADNTWSRTETYICLWGE